MVSTEIVDDALLLIEQNFYFLHAGEFFALWSRREDLSSAVPNRLIKVFEGGFPYTFDGRLIQTVLTHEYATPDDQASLLEYFIEFNAFRGIMMGMIEAVQDGSPFGRYWNQRLGKKRFENLIDIVAFIRNVLSHNTHAEIRLNEKDYSGRRKRIERMGRDLRVRFSLQYYNTLPEINVPSTTYGIDLQVDFGSLKPQTPFLSVVSMGDLMLLSELCFNLSLIYRNQAQTAVLD